MLNETPPSEAGPYWDQETGDLFARLASSSQGLGSAEAAQRLERVGLNSLTTRRQVTPFGLFLGQFKSPIVLILVVASLISAYVKDWPDALIILAIVLGSAVLSFAQEYTANNAADKLKEQVSAKATVLREGQERAIPLEEIVPGDVVILSAGSLIPADGVVLEAKDFFVNQAALTGETFPVEKKPGKVPPGAALAERSNCVYLGTNVRSGTAKALVVKTGAGTAFGQIASRLTLRPPENEFERGIRKLGYLLTEVMLVLVVAIFAINVSFHKPLLDSLLFSIALGVGLTPQLLPAIININLSKGSQKMAQRGVIVRRLASIENFGSMDILCTDKTGTLTMGVVSLDHAYNALGEESDQVRCAAWRNAHFQSGMTNPLDEAILASIPESEQAAVKVDEIPYDFIRKRLSVVMREGDQHTLITKGALEKVLEVCTSVILDGEAAALDEARLSEFEARFAGWSEQGYRVLGVAQKPVAAKEIYSKTDERGMALLGFLLFFDPPKPKVEETLGHLKRLGVQLKIITGDNHLVARHTAQAIGMPAPNILTGAELEQLRDEALWIRAEKTDIFAEVDPNEKERIILALKKTGHVVGYMGDGINDAPSLHSADVGISVDNAVAVAKEAADFVLLQHDLAVLIQGILEGRRTFANTLKYVFMAVSANFGNMFSVAGASLFIPFLPLLPKQILLINFLTDFPEMTIAGDNVDMEFLHQPHRWDVNFIRRFMLVFGTLSSVFDYLTFAFLLWWLRLAEAQFQTGWFLESTLSAMLVVFALRTRLPVLRSRPSRALLSVTLVAALIVVVIPYTPLAGVMGFAPLPLPYLLVILGIILLYFVAAEVAKRWFYQHYRD